MTEEPADNDAPNSGAATSEEMPEENGTSTAPATESRGDFETDALRLIALAADALGDQADFPDFDISRDSFNESGTPEVLFIGRSEEGDIQWAIWESRSEVKSHVKGHSVDLYKRIRKIMMQYEMGEEIPVLTIGQGGNVGVAIVTLEETPQILSP